MPVDPKILNEPCFAVEIVVTPEGRARYKLLTPEKVLGGRVTNKDQLLFELSRRHHNAIGLHAKTVSERRWHMERERPALRWYCRQFGVPVPNWLKGNGGYDLVTPSSFKQLFGNAPLRPLVFRSWAEQMQRLPPPAPSKKMGNKPSTGGSK